MPVNEGSAMSLPDFEELTVSQIRKLSYLGYVFDTKKESIRLLTLRKSADAIFHLSDDEWVAIAEFPIEYRPLFERAIKTRWEEFEEMWDFG